MTQSAKDAEDLVGAMEPLARALAHHLETGTPSTVEFRRDDGLWYSQSTLDFFEVPQWIQDIEKIALDLAQEPVLDAGAGFGRHALELQNRGLSVTALDIHPEFVRLMRARGVVDARVADVRNIELNGFATVYFLMETIGLCESLEGLGKLLRKLKQVVNEDGQIIFDSEAIVIDPDIRDKRSHFEYEGEVTMQMRYGSLQGNPFRWLYLDPDTLVEVAADNGWHAHIAVVEPETEHYLARLSHLPS